MLVIATSRGFESKIEIAEYELGLGKHQSTGFVVTLGNVFVATGVGGQIFTPGATALQGSHKGQHQPGAETGAGIALLRSLDLLAKICPGKANFVGHGGRILYSDGIEKITVIHGAGDIRPDTRFGCVLKFGKEGVRVLALGGHGHLRCLPGISGITFSNGQGIARSRPSLLSTSHRRPQQENQDRQENE